MTQEELAPSQDAPRPQFKKRNEAIDVAKGIAILSIMLGHMGIDMGEPGEYLIRFTYLYHVPLFFMLSGYFLSAKKPFGTFVREKAFRLLIPYVFTCVLIGFVFFLLWVFFGLSVNEPFYNAKDFVIACLWGAGSLDCALPDGITAVGAIWFLEALFVGFVIMRLAIVKEKAAPFIAVGCFIVGYVSAQFLWLPLNIQSGLMACLFLYLGYLFRKKKLWERPVKPLLLVLFIIVFVIGFIFKMKISIASGRLGVFVLTVPVSVICCWLVVMVSQLIDQHCPRLKRFFTFYGLNSLVVLCFHITVQKTGLPELAIWIGLPQAYGLFGYVNFVFQMLVLYPVVKAVQKTKYLRKVFY